MEKTRHFRVIEAAPQRVDLCLSENTDLTRSHIQKLIDNGKVKINDKIVVARSVKVKENDLIEFLVELPKAFVLKPSDIPVDIIFEDENMLVINKQAGLVVHPAPGHYEDTLVNALLGKYIKEEDFVGKGPRLGIVHRLDRDTSGVMVVARNTKAFDKLQELFKKKEVTKIYNCFVHGPMEEGEINANIGRSSNNRKKFTAGNLVGKEARTLFTPLENFKAISFLKVKIVTGRTHQIRVHMNFLKHEVLGDDIYGNKNRDMKLAEELGYDRNNYKEIMPRQMLHALTLSFTHPITLEQKEFTAPLPADFKRLLKLLRADSRQ